MSVEDQITCAAKYPPDIAVRAAASLEWDGKNYHRLFVYGTLKQGERLHGTLHSSPYSGTGRLQGYIMLHLGHFPGIVRAPADAEGWTVYGEIYDVDDHTLAVIDGIEGHPTYYERKEVTLDGIGKSWTYVQPEKELWENRMYIPSGRWNGSGVGTFKWTKNTKPGLPLVSGATTQPQPQHHPRLALPSSSRVGDAIAAIAPPVREVTKKETKIQVGPGWEEG